MKKNTLKKGHEEEKNEKYIKESRVTRTRRTGGKVYVKFIYMRRETKTIGVHQY
jgi:hypothetical protein